MTWGLGALCELSWVLLETDGSEAFGRQLLNASIELYESGFDDRIRHTERFGWNLCYLLAGDNEKTLDVMALELENNFADRWRWWLQIPPYDAIREDPRFVAMRAEFERRMTEQRNELRRRDQARPSFEF